MTGQEEGDLIERARFGDADARRKLAMETIGDLYKLRRPSLSLGIWIAEVLGTLCAADDKASLDKALAMVGGKRRPGGRPKKDNVVRDLEIAGAVQVLAEAVGKEVAVAAVAAGFPIAESTVWAACSANAKLRGLNGLAGPVLKRLRESAAREPLVYSKELRDFFAVTPEG